MRIYAPRASAECVSFQTFGWQTFKRVGASRTVNRVYNLVLMFSIGIQLALFFVGASAALWVDQVYNGNIGRLTKDPTFFKAIMITVLVLLIPWLSVVSSVRPFSEPDQADNVLLSHRAGSRSAESTGFV